MFRAPSNSSSRPNNAQTAQQVVDLSGSLLPVNQHIADAPC